MSSGIFEVRGAQRSTSWELGVGDATVFFFWGGSCLHTFCCGNFMRLVVFFCSRIGGSEIGDGVFCTKWRSLFLGGKSGNFCFPKWVLKRFKNRAPYGPSVCFEGLRESSCCCCCCCCCGCEQYLRV